MLYSFMIFPIKKVKKYFFRVIIYINKDVKDEQAKQNQIKQ